jgi:hypothetical protein
MVLNVKHLLLIPTKQIFVTLNAELLVGTRPRFSQLEK